MTIRQALLAGLAAPLSDLGVDLEDVEVSRAGRRELVRVVVDRDGGVDLDLVAAVSSRVSQLLDEEPLASVIDGAFVLEVTSPGVDRPLTQTRHWRRAVDRLVRIELRDGASLEGRILDVPDDETVEVTVDGERHSVPRADVVRAVVQVEFNRETSVESGD
jgi:ribosome maturation factor RimP